MDIINSFIEATLFSKIIILCVIAAIAYVTAKARNLAKLDDIGKLTKVVESVKSEIDIIKHESTLKFTKLHEKRFEVIEELYAKIVRLNDSALILTQEWNMEGNKQKDNETTRLKKFIEAYDDLRTYWFYKNIYFDEDITLRMLNLLSDYIEKVSTYNEIKSLKEFAAEPPEHLRETFFKEAAKNSDDARLYIEKTIQPFLIKLKRDFQVIIGIENPINKK